MATENIPDLTCIIDPDWRTLECIRPNGGAQDVNLVLLLLTLKDCRDPLTAARPEALVGNACQKTDTLNFGEVAARYAEAITHACSPTPVPRFSSERHQSALLERTSGSTTSCLSCLRPAARQKQLLCQRRRSECQQASVEFLRWRLDDSRIPIWLPSSRSGNAKIINRPAKNVPSATLWVNEVPYF